MHQAYNVYSVVKQGVHIESIAAYENKVILGTRSGQLIMYSVDLNGVPDMIMFNKNFSKKPITQMEVIAKENLLFVLTDSVINVCDIGPNEKHFSLVRNSPETRGTSLFAVDIKTAKSTTGETATVIRVCCAIKRRLQFFYWKMDHLKSPEFSIELKDVPKALSWVEGIVCVGYKDEYVMYNILSKKPEKFDLIVTSSSQSVDPCICLMRNNLLGISKDEYLVVIDPNDYIKKSEGKSQPHGGLEKPNGTSLKPMQWSSTLLGLVWDEPFAIGRVADCIEIRNSDSTGIIKDTLVQIIPELAKIRYLVRAGPGVIFAAAISELWCMSLVDIPTQRKQLIQQKRYQLAIELTQVSEESTEEKAETIRQVHMRFARELFLNKQFSAAMDEFEKASADPVDVIRLFPNLLSEQPKSANNENNENAIPAPEIPPLSGKDLENAYLALIAYLAQARQKELGKSSSKFRLSIIDTTLLKCYLETNDTLLAPLLRLKQCHFEESEKTLKKKSKITELIILYQVNGKHKKALELLKSEASVKGSSLYGYERTIRYLQDLGSPHLPLIFEFADWVLTEHPGDGLRIFTESIIEVENLPRAQVLDFLLTRHKNLVIPYLEHVINIWEDSNTLLHNVLIKQYREKVQYLIEQNENEELENYRSKLFEILKHSTKYSPDVVLKDFPTNTMLKERALILGRLGKHENVLAIYIQILGDIEKASEYCEQTYEKDKDIFVTMVKTILNPLATSPYEGVTLHPDFIQPNHEIVLDILNKYTVKIDPSQIWPYLPDDMPLHRLHYYIDTVLRKKMAESHEMQIKAGFLSSEILRVTAEIKKQERKSFEINEFSVCPECKKRFSNQTPFVRYPNGQIVHLLCHDKKVQSSQSNFKF